MVVFSLCYGLSVNKESIQAQGKYGTGKVVYMVKDEVVRTPAKLRDIPYTFLALMGSVEVGTYEKVQVDIGVTNAYYPEFHQMNIEGTFFSKYSAGEGVLLSDILASRLYKSTDVIGKELEIKGRAYTILGIYNKKDAFNGDRRMQKEIVLMDPQGAKAIGQEMTMVDYEVPKAYATQFERRMGDEWRNGIYESQIDMDQRIGIMNQKLYLFLFILGVLTCIELLRAAYGHGIKMIGTFKKGVKNHYRLEAIKRYRKDFIYNGFMVITLVATSLYSFRLAKVDWSILPSRIPKVLTDVDAYYAMGKAMLMAAVNRQEWFNYIGYSTLVINDFFQMGLLLISATLLCINRLMGVRHLVSGKTIRVIFWLSSLTAVAFVYLMKQVLVYDMGLMVIVLYYIVGLGCTNRQTS